MDTFLHVQFKFLTLSKVKILIQMENLNQSPWCLSVSFFFLGKQQCNKLSAMRYTRSMRKSSKNLHKRCTGTSKEPSNLCNFKLPLTVLEYTNSNNS